MSKSSNLCLSREGVLILYEIKTPSFLRCEETLVDDFVCNVDNQMIKYVVVQTNSRKMTKPVDLHLDELQFKYTFQQNKD